jgi:RNA polymerase sigma-70 factor (ECF subfamily)
VPTSSDLPGPSDIHREIAEARAGSREALGWLFDSCRQYLLLVANEEIRPDLRAKFGASDVVQQTFLEAQRDFAGFRGDSRAALQGWLRQILVHNVRNVRRRHSTAKRELGREVTLTSLPLDHVGDAADGQTPSRHAIANEEDVELQRALARLPELYRTVIVLRHRENQSFLEIGRAINRTPEAARKVWARAIEQIQHLVDNHETR